MNSNALQLQTRSPKLLPFYRNTIDPYSMFDNFKIWVIWYSLFSHLTFNDVGHKLVLSFRRWPMNYPLLFLTSSNTFILDLHWILWSSWNLQDDEGLFYYLWKSTAFTTLQNYTPDKYFSCLNIYICGLNIIFLDILFI